MKYRHFIFATLLLLLGCSTTRYIAPDQNLKIDEDCKLETLDSKIVLIRAPSIEKDSVSGQYLNSSDSIKLPRDRIRNILIKDRSLGFIKGFGSGIAFGVLSGVIIASAIINSCPEAPTGREDPEVNCTGYGLGGLAAGIGIAVTSVVMGSIVGVVKGEETNYVFQDSSAYQLYLKSKPFGSVPSSTVVP